MAVLHIVKYPDPALRQVSQIIGNDDRFVLRRIVDDMLDTMYDGRGVGLAAIQVGLPLRLFVADVGQGPECYANPHLLETYGGQVMRDEGCLSLPGVQERVLRHRHAKMSYIDLLDHDPACPVREIDTGMMLTDEERARGDDLRAHVLQHEMEHLDGGIFVDHLSTFRRERLLKRLKKGK